MGKITKQPNYIGLQLVAIDPCVMSHSKEPTLTVDKVYYVTDTYVNGIIVKDDEGTDHYFNYDDIYRFFYDR